MKDSKEKTAPERHPHRWGFHDTQFIMNENKEVHLSGERYNLCGYTIPDLIPFVELETGVDIDPKKIQVEKEVKKVPSAIVNEGFLEAVKGVLADHQLNSKNKVRLVHSHGQTSADEIYKVLYSGTLDRVVDLVVYPESEENVEKIVALAKEHDVCLVPYGGGTNVSGALVCLQDEKRMIVSVDMGRMNRVLWIDKQNFRACIEAGVSGRDLEEKLGQEGYILGHEPDSLEFSTLGGWISTNASGMKKNRYGNIEDIVEDVTMITPEGLIESKNSTPRRALGIQPHYLLFGSEGNLGIITKAIVKVYKKPEKREYGSLVFPNFEKGVEFLYHLRHEGTLPASIRLVDNLQFRFGHSLKPSSPDVMIDKLKKFFLFKVKGFDPMEMAACTVLMEGSTAEVDQQKNIIFPMAKKYGGVSGGASNGERGYLLTFAIAYIRDFFSRYHIIGETFETSIAWDKIVPTCHAVVKKAEEKHKEFNLPGKPFLSYRVTQTYHTGVCIYFIYAFSHQGIDNPTDIFHKIERELRITIMEHGGSLSHHHGVGKIRQSFLPQVFSETGMESLRQWKDKIDPKNIFGIGNGVFQRGEEKH